MRSGNLYLSCISCIVPFAIKKLKRLACLVRVLYRAFWSEFWSKACGSGFICCPSYGLPPHICLRSCLFYQELPICPTEDQVPRSDHTPMKPVCCSKAYLSASFQDGHQQRYPQKIPQSLPTCSPPSPRHCFSGGYRWSHSWRNNRATRFVCHHGLSTWRHSSSTSASQPLYTSIKRRFHSQIFQNGSY